MFNKRYFEKPLTTLNTFSRYGNILNVLSMISTELNKKTSQSCDNIYERNTSTIVQMHKDNIFRLKCPFQIFFCKWSSDMCCVFSRTCAWQIYKVLLETYVFHWLLKSFKCFDVPYYRRWMLQENCNLNSISLNIKSVYIVMNNLSTLGYSNHYSIRVYWIQ